MIKNLISFFMIAVPAIGMLSGLSSATSITSFLLVLLFWLRHKLRFSVKKHGIEIIFALWCLISCFWSVNIKASLSTYATVSVLLFLGLLLQETIRSEKHFNIHVYNPIKIGILSSIILFFIEYTSDGILSKAFWHIFQPNRSMHFVLYMLDRGCALLSVTSWVMICMFTLRKKYAITIISFFVISYVLYISDSLASFVGFNTATLIFLLMRFIILPYCTIKILNLITIIIFISGAILMPMITYSIKPIDIIKPYSNVLTESAKHRIFIWHFVMNKYLEKPLLGQGFASSKKIQISDNELVHYESKILSPLPLHPHNNILQILFETGLIGFILFILFISKLFRNINKLVNESQFDLLAISYACFANYFIIGMISFSMWQTWFVCTGVWIMILLTMIYQYAKHNKK